MTVSMAIAERTDKMDGRFITIAVPAVFGSFMTTFIFWMTW